MQEDRIIAAFCILSVSFTLRHFRHCFRHSLAAVQIILFQRMRINPQGDIRSGVSCSLGSVSNYLAITAEDIRSSKENRLVLEEIYTSLLNDINPGAVDEITQEHLRNLRDMGKL